MNKSTLLLLCLSAVTLGVAIITWHFVLNVGNNFNMMVNTDFRNDERNINDSTSVGEGIKFIFINAVTGERIRNEKVTLDSDNGILCSDIGCDSSDEIFETQTDQNGVAFIDFNQWSNFTFGQVKLENYGCAGSISNYPTDNHLYFTEATEKLSLECVPKSYGADEAHSKYLKLLVAGTEEELINKAVTIDIENCSGDMCNDLNDTTVTSNPIGNIFFDGDYVRAETYLLIDGYQPKSIRYKYDPPNIVYFIPLNGTANNGIDDESKIKISHGLQNGIELYFSEHGTYPQPQTWNEFIGAIGDYIKPTIALLEQTETDTGYTYGFSTGKEYCLMTILTKNDVILSMATDSDAKQCGILAGWKSVSSATPQTECNDDKLMLCLAN